MPQALQTVVRKLRRWAGLPKPRDLTDRQLLERFQAGEESAFAALVDRHGPLVLGICRRVLQHVQDAEDAFQATFLVLARKAGSVPWRDTISNWLHSVALRIARKVRAQALRRSAKEKLAGECAPMATQPPVDPSWTELRPVLDEELARLPKRYRAPLILCYL